ncbi:uncharacterized protein LOC143367051 [Andrena cerasifolii]|uniref:uncharacterized protein LOC143367051 n=1 Tax=Andrena cerasifolii TaxID=2819439 RepID=UPI0040377D7C
MFLPPNTTSILQPMDQGIIAKMKRSFRHKMLRRILEYPGGIQEFHRKYDLKDCINFVHEAWGDVEPINVANVWKKIMGITPPVTPDTKEEPTDALEAQLEAIIGEVIEEQPSEQRLVEYINACEDTETLSAEETKEDNEKQKETQQEELLEEDDEEEEEEAEKEEEPVEETEEEEEPVAETEQEQDIEQKNLNHEVSAEEGRIRHLQELFDDLQMHAQDESEFIQDTILN